MDRNIEADCHKLASAFFDNLQFDDSCEYGSLGTDCKRPFGNSSVEADILKIIGWDPEGDDGDGACYASWQKEYANDLFQVQLIPFLQKEWKRLIQHTTGQVSPCTCTRDSKGNLTSICYHCAEINVG